MKRIEFIAPVESMRGNLGEKQSLVYAPNNNRAYDSIMDKLNPALNYEPRLIASKGRRNYFSVKTKSSVHLTQKSKTAMSLLGGIGAIYAALVSDKTADVYVNTNACYQDAVDGGYTGTLRKWLHGRISYALKNKLAAIEITTRQHSASIDNPWIYGEDSNIHVAIDILIKFWDIFASNPITFSVDGEKGIAHANYSFRSISEMGSYNVLNITWGQVNIDGVDYEDAAYIMLDEENVNVRVITKDGAPINAFEEIVQAINYTTIMGRIQGG